MALNWGSPIIIISLVSLIPLIFVTVLTLIQYLKDKYSHLKYLIGVSACGTIMIFFQIVSNLTVYNEDLSENLQIFYYYAFIPMGYFAILFIDSVTRDSIDFLKVILMTITSTAVVLLSFLPDAITFNYAKNESKTKYTTFNGYFRTAAIIQMTLIISVAVYGWLKILRHTPKNLKNYSRLNFLGAYLYMIQPYLFQIPFLSESSSIKEKFPGISTASMAIGILLFVIIFIKVPKLAYILPFKAYRIMIQRTSTSIILFKHDWNELEAPDSENIFSGMMHAISTMFDLTINKGNVKKIKFEEAEITFKASKKGHLACILISSASSITLRSSFEKFSDDVFKDYINIENNAHSTNSYTNGIVLLEKNFPFIP